MMSEATTPQKPYNQSSPTANQQEELEVEIELSAMASDDLALRCDTQTAADALLEGDTGTDTTPLDITPPPFFFHQDDDEETVPRLPFSLEPQNIDFIDPRDDEYDEESARALQDSLNRSTPRTSTPDMRGGPEPNWALVSTMTSSVYAKMAETLEPEYFLFEEELSTFQEHITEST
ncbi:hypothetical protein QCA50_012590 [Cerrena zonata]|uniref:Uncharacterized protein n=1 Tax=Cerrena zonata TaxID=2478898 RepID=A0AAW0FTU6_9APHY